MEQSALKKQILDFSRDEGQDNRRCIDCASPHPQWASANNAVFMCIQCAGVHRGFGVHISFVRSVTMDTWKPDEVTKMKLGGNNAFRDFLTGYTCPSEAFTWKYSPEMHSKSLELYSSWAAAQYREKLSSEMEGKPWSPSAPSATFLASQTPSRPSSAQSTRTRGQARASTTQPSSLRNASPSPAPSVTAGTTSTLPVEQKTANENFFATLGASNASRREDLPPSQGGKYQGFGSSPSPPPPEALALSSKSLPSLQEVQTDPGAALSKGWSFLSTALAGASKAMNENIIQPGMQTVRENAPGVQQRMGVLASSAHKTLGDVGGIVKDRTGVDVAEGWGTLVDKVKTMNVTGRPENDGYRGVNDGWGEFEGEEGSALYHDDPDHDGFFDAFEGQAAQQSPPASATSQQPETPKHVEKEGWDDWKDF